MVVEASFSLAPNVNFMSNLTAISNGDKYTRMLLLIVVLYTLGQV